jgi:hypothetical protein
MSRLRLLPALLLTVVATATVLVACSDEGHPVPERCAEPKLEVFDYRAADPPADDNRKYPCVTPVGHGISNDDASSAGTGNSGGGAGGSGAAGDAGTGGS